MERWKRYSRAARLALDGLTILLNSGWLVSTS
jgi:hypothetical protein